MPLALMLNPKAATSEDEQSRASRHCAAVRACGLVESTGALLLLRRLTTYCEIYYTRVVFTSGAAIVAHAHGYITVI